MIRFLVRRSLFLLLSLWIVSVIAFLLPYVGQSDPARVIVQARLGDAAVDPEVVSQLSKRLGLDQPLYVQYLNWVLEAISGDLGYSFTSRQSVALLVANALVVSLVLAAVVMLTAVLIAVPLGTVAAIRAGSRVDEAIMTVTQAFVPVPEFWLGPFGILVFAVTLHWLPAAGWLGPAYVILPTVVLALRPIAYLVAVTRAAMIDVLASPYFIAARSRGLSQRQTVIRHGLRNVAAPVTTLFSVWFASLVGGSVIVEVVFAIPGTGRLLYEAVIDSDIPVIQGALLAIVFLVVVINSLTDIAYGILNPAVASLGSSR
jgi:peptide/nickel transport system permease protein